MNELPPEQVPTAGGGGGGGEGNVAAGGHRPSDSLLPRVSGGSVPRGQVEKWDPLFVPWLSWGKRDLYRVFAVYVPCITFQSIL